MNPFLPHRASLLCVALLLMAGCGDERGGEEASPSSVGAGGEGGQTSTGGATASSTSTGSGEDGAACIACIAGLEQADCTAEFGSCRVLMRCQGWYGCTEDCALGDNSATCYTGCDGTFLPSNSANQNLKGCACDYCWEQCPTFCTCGEY